ncbi:MAG TPA: ribosomal protein S18-alanine N-acetyltransferase [Candidatus Dormibacteraeota bacterium]|jgi:ribosomal-protein-alanine N-acetyltransferase|nr:ribosomal protein S18-alanine N-acetyltransferase [Candidatus Dormibacteraeota bacterium]
MESLTTQTVKIRPVKTEDLKAVYAMEDACFKDPFPSYFINQLASANPATFLVATDGDRIVGYAAVDNWTDHRHLVSIAVLCDSRRKGIGQALLDGLYGQLPEGPLRLELRKSNQPALELYLKNGFYQTGVAHNYYPDGEEAIQMEKIIRKKVEVISAA